MSLKGVFKDCDKVLLIFSIVLCLFGLFNIVNVSSQEATAISTDNSIYFYFFKQFLFVIIGFIFALIIMSYPMNMNKGIIQILFVVVAFLNAYVALKGTFTRGANNWIKFGPFSIQPSELSKPVIIVLLSFIFERFAKRLKNPNIDNTKIFFYIAIVSLVIPVFVFFQRDIGTMSIILGTVTVMIWFAPINKKALFKFFKYIIFAVVAILLGLMIIKGGILTGAQKSRLDFINPCDSEKFQHGGYQVCNAFIAINRGNLTGVGIGKSTQKYSYIPEPHTDMVFAIISEEYGFIIGSLIIISYLVIIYRILDLAQYATSISGRFMCLGVSVYMFLHVFINLGGMFGLIPLTGVPLPFLSYGGSFLISLLASLAVVQRVYIDTKRCKENII